MLIKPIKLLSILRNVSFFQSNKSLPPSQGIFFVSLPLSASCNKFNSILRIWNWFSFESLFLLFIRIYRVHQMDVTMSFVPRCHDFRGHRMKFSNQKTSKWQRNSWSTQSNSFVDFSPDSSPLQLFPETLFASSIRKSQ